MLPERPAAVPLLAQVSNRESAKVPQHFQMLITRVCRREKGCALRGNKNFCCMLLIRRPKLATTVGKVSVEKRQIELQPLPPPGRRPRRTTLRRRRRHHRRRAPISGSHLRLKRRPTLLRSSCGSSRQRDLDSLRRSAGRLDGPQAPYVGQRRGLRLQHSDHCALAQL